jgi:hypothetical protein
MKTVYNIERAGEVWFQAEIEADAPNAPARVLYRGAAEIGDRLRAGFAASTCAEILRQEAARMGAELVEHATVGVYLEE